LNFCKLKINQLSFLCIPEKSKSLHGRNFMKALKEFLQKKYAAELSVGILVFIFYLVRDLLKIFFP